MASLRLGVRHRQILGLLKRFPRGFGLSAFIDDPYQYRAIYRAAIGLRDRHGLAVLTAERAGRSYLTTIRPALFEPLSGDSEAIAAATETIRRELWETLYPPPNASSRDSTQESDRGVGGREKGMSGVVFGCGAFPASRPSPGGFR